MQTLSKIMRGVAKLEKVIIGICLAVATVVIMYGVLGRQVDFIKHPQWSEEAVRYLMIWITFIGSGICFRRSSHYGIDVIRRIKSPAFQKFVSIFVIAACAIFAILLLVYGGKMTMFTFKTGQLTAALRWPIWLVYLSVPVGGALILIHLVEVFMSEVLGIYTIEE